MPPAEQQSATAPASGNSADGNHTNTTNNNTAGTDTTNINPAPESRQLRRANPPVGQTRNYEKYPIFDEQFPERRLNMKADPDCRAEIAGIPR